MLKRWSLVPLALSMLVGCQTTPASSEANVRRDTVKAARSQAGMVVSDSPIASQVGADILEHGGNAVDAAIATAFAMAVTWPEAGNVGGGGFMLVASPDGSPPICIDYREVAPGASTADMYMPGENRHHPRHAGVPGTVAGLALAHQKYGKLPWKSLVLPAVVLARDGFIVDAVLADSLNAALDNDEARTSPHLAELTRVYGKPGGERWQAGDTLTLPDLANTLQAIADHGRDGFYRGEVARLIAEGMTAGGGIITEQDLIDYEAKTRPATHVTYRGHDIYGMPPPSSGGISIALALQILEPLNLRDQPRFSPRNIHLIAEAMRRAFHQRALHLGDSDFVEVPMDRLMSRELADELRASIDPSAATPSESLQPVIPLADEAPSTTHFSVIDADGMAVANTYTLEENWGSRVIMPGTGVVLNNEMGDFNWTPGRTTRFGPIGTPANVIEPGKRMLSSMAPTIVMKDGKPVLITGSPGGRTIINTALCIVLNVVEFEMSPAEAVAAPRMHHQWLPDVMVLEDRGVSYDVAELEAMGHRVDVRDAPQGSAHTIAVDGNTYLGLADDRRGGEAVGVGVGAGK